MALAVLPMVELVEVAEGVLEPSDHPGTHPDRFFSKIVHETCFKCSFSININWYLLYLPMVELVEVAEGVLEPSDHLGTHPDRFLFKNRS